MQWLVKLLVMGLGIAGFGLGARAAEQLAVAKDDPAGIEFFEKKIRPVMAERCYECHSAKAKKVKGKLKMDTKEDFEKGGETGKIVIPGDVEKSPIIKAVRWKDEDLQMPPKEKLPDEQIKLFEEWVKMGAPYPATKKAATAVTSNPSDVVAAARAFWSFQQPREYPVPGAKHNNWVRTEIDAFVAAKLEGRDLEPGPAADRRTLIRRATLDLTGLPPTI